MKKILSLLALAAFAAFPAAAHSERSAAAPANVIATAGKMLYSADGRSVAAIYRVEPDGSPQIILDGRMVTVPASTLSVQHGKITTSLTKAQIEPR